MKLTAILFLVTASIAGCSTQGLILNGNPSSVTIRHDGSYRKSTELAVQHCSQYSKDARLIHTEGWIMSFDCMSRQDSSLTNENKRDP
jgi:hypothetical protein